MGNAEWICAQLGPREHYAVPRALHKQHLLAGLITDWYAYGRTEDATFVGEGPALVARSAWLAGFTRRLSTLIRYRSARAARTNDIPDRKVRSFPLRTLLWKLRVKWAAGSGMVYDAFARTDAAFARSVARLELPPHGIFFGYSYASLEMLQAEHRRGVFTVLGQFDPGAAEFRLVAEEMRLHPEISGPPPEFPTINFERNRREWALADLILVNSEWSREALLAEGADPAKIEIVPLAYETPESEATAHYEAISRHLPMRGPLKVLWLGQANIRKGIHHLMKAARLLESENVHFDIVGPIGILPSAVASAPQNMTFHGPVSRDRAADWYRQSDVFVLPTLSDGFALTQLEALAHGLPVIATPNCGRVVENRKTGLVIPPRNPEALAEAILYFVQNRTRAREMAPVCRASVEAFSLQTLGRNLVDTVTRHLHPFSNVGSA